MSGTSDVKLNACVVITRDELLKCDFAVLKQDSEGITMWHESSTFKIHVHPSENNAVIELVSGDYMSMVKSHVIIRPEDIAVFIAQLMKVMPLMSDIIDSRQSICNSVLFNQLMACSRVDALWMSDFAFSGDPAKFEAFPVPVVGLMPVFSAIALSTDTTTCDTPMAYEQTDEIDEELNAAIRESDERMNGY